MTCRRCQTLSMPSDLHDRLMDCSREVYDGNVSMCVRDALRVHLDAFDAGELRPVRLTAVETRSDSV